MKKKSDGEPADSILSVSRNAFLLMLAYGLTIYGSIKLEGYSRLLSITLFYAVSIVLYFWAVQFDQVMGNAGGKIHNKTKGSFWFIGSIVTALLIHYFFF